MIDYSLLKVVHIVSSTILFGTGIGTAFFKWSIDRSRSVAAIRATAEQVVLADWLFTTPTIILQPLTGILLARASGWSLASRWLEWAYVLYLIAALCWIPVVVLQLRMRALARQADGASTGLDLRYWRLARWWFWLGIPAFAAMIATYWLMVEKPL